MYSASAVSTARFVAPLQNDAAVPTPFEEPQTEASADWEVPATVLTTPEHEI